MSDDPKKYFEYNVNGGSKWWRKETPTADPAFQEGLNRIAGTSDFGQPKLRLSWAGTLMHDITEKPRLKYMQVRTITSGYNYVKTDGTIGTTKSMNLPKDAKVPWEFYPRTERLELGRLRWVVEQHIPAHELHRLGRFRNRRAPDGELILRELPNEGVYDHYFWIETAARKYRAPDMEVLTAIEAMWKYQVSTPIAQQVLDEHERERQEVLVGAKEARRIFASL